MSAADALARRIAREGPVTVAEFMATALLHPRHGYYMRGGAIGRAGDFITAPEVHQAFGETLGAWCVDFWERAGGPRPFVLLELGPGRGTLMRDVLRAARSVRPAFADAAEVWLVEASPALREEQARAVPGARFALDPGGAPEGFTIALANEFLDALPVRQFARHEGRWEERLVGWDPARGGFAFTRSGRPSPFAAGLAADAPEGTVAEISPAAHAVAAGLAGRVRESGGAALLLDYGRDPDEPAGTLRAVRRHRPDDPLRAPGEADLSVRVDFDALAGTARAEGARVLGPAAQGAFLERLGIRERAGALAWTDPARAAGAAAGVRRLTAPGAMGARFQALALAGPEGPEPAGFAP